MPSQPSTQLDTFPNPKPEIDYTIRMSIPEFTCLCPKTGQPDFATLQLEYEIAAALAAVTSPRYLKLTAVFNVRGGIYTTVVATRRQAGWNPEPAVVLP
jgi:7-cyano-7-deazaguanine reductase